MTVRDYGRGIPLGKVVDCVSKMHTGGKYNDDVFQFSVGLNGVGTKAVNALSESLRGQAAGAARKLQARLVRAAARRSGSRTATTQATPRTGTYVRPSRPIPEIFGEYVWNEEFIEHRLRYYTYLNTGLTVTYNGRALRSKNGLKDLLKAEFGEEKGLYPVAHFKEGKLEFAFTHTNNYGETYFSFVNGQHTADGGTHQSAFREGFLKGVNEFAKKSFAGGRRARRLRGCGGGEGPGAGFREPDQEQARLDRRALVDRPGGARRHHPLAARQRRHRPRR